MFYEEAKALDDKNTLSVYALFLAKLSLVKAISQDEINSKNYLKQSVEKLFLNHQQNLSILKFHIKQAIDTSVVTPLQCFLVDVHQSLDVQNLGELFTLNDSIELKLNDLNSIVARRFESHIATEILTSPAKELQDVVNKVSLDLIDLIQTHKSLIELTSEDSNNEYLAFLYNSFFTNLGPSSENIELPNIALAFARYQTKPNFKSIIDTLESGTDLARVILIHFMFMRNIFPRLDIESLNFQKIYNGMHKGDFEKIIANKDETDPRYFFNNYPTYAPHLYTDRGRVRFEPQLSTQMGIMLSEVDANGLPKRDTSCYPDSLSNVPDLNSNYVKSLTYQGIPYVSGPSGMTSILSGVLTFFGDLELLEKQQYTLAIMAFIVGGGLHSIHEVLTVPAVRLGLLDFYKVEGRDIGNYYDYFNYLSKDIPSINVSLDTSFNYLNIWFKDRFEMLCNVDCYKTKTAIEQFESYKSETQNFNLKSCCIL